MEMLYKFIKNLEDSKKSVHTITAYKKALLDFYKDLSITDDDLNKLTEDDFRDYLKILQEKYSDKSVNQKLAILKSFYNYLFKKGVVEENTPKPIDELILVKKLPKFLEIDESQKLLQTARSLDTGKPIDLRNRLIIELFLDTGVRAFEMESLKISNIDFKTGETHVLGKGKKWRYVKIHPNNLKLIERWLDVRKSMKIKEEFKDFLIVNEKNGENLKKRAIQYVVEKYVGLTDIEQISVHKLRHTYASTMLSTETLTLREVKERMGHKFIETTEIYAHALKKQQKNNPLFD